MLCQFVIVAFLIGLEAAARPARSLKFRQVTAPVDCPTTGVHVIAVSGAGDVPIDGYGRLGNLSTSILNAIPGSTSVQVPYDKPAADQLVATTAGSVNFTNYVNDFHASCPCSKVVVIGYSSGSIISMNSLCGASPPWTSPAAGFDSSYRDFIVGIIEYGDETHTASAPYNLGTCTGSGRYPRTAANAACPIFADRIQSYCDIADPQCCLGTVDNAHFLYDSEYDAASSQFLAQRAASFGDVCLSTTSSSTSSLNSATSFTSTPVPTQASSTTSSVTPSSSLAQSSTTTGSALPTSTPVCPTSLETDWQFPHLIVPVSSSDPNNAYGTSYNGKVDSTTSSIFNFDIPSSYAGSICTLFFSLPELSTLMYSSYTTSGSPGIAFSLLSGVADITTTYANMPAVKTSYGDYTVTPGSRFVVTSGPCAAGQTLGYAMSATGDYALDYFQESGDVIGLYISAC